jgi:Protein of unknown function (DUF1573)
MPIAVLLYIYNLIRLKMNRKFGVIVVLLICACITVFAKSKNIPKFKKRQLPNITELKPAFIKTVGGDVFDFNTVTRGKVIRHSFEFYNTGEKVLNIDQVVSYCKCIQVQYDVLPILPGMKGHINVTLNTRELRGDIKKEIYIISNAATLLNEKRYTLYLQGTVINEKDFTDDRRSVIRLGDQ